MGQGNIVVFSFGTFFGKVFSKDRIPVADVLGCVVKGMSQVAGATFFHVSIAVREFSGLVCRWRAASVSKNFVRRTEIGEIPDFCKDHSSGVYSHAGNRENWWIELIYDFLNRIFDFVDLGGKFLNEFNGMLQFQRFGRHDRANRSSGCLSNLDGFLFSVASFGRCCRLKCHG